MSNLMRQTAGEYYMNVLYGHLKPSYCYNCGVPIDKDRKADNATMLRRKHRRNIKGVK